MLVLDLKISAPEVIGTANVYRVLPGLVKLEEPPVLGVCKDC